MTDTLKSIKWPTNIMWIVRWWQRFNFEVERIVWELISAVAWAEGELPFWKSVSRQIFSTVSFWKTFLHCVFFHCAFLEVCLFPLCISPLCLFGRVCLAWFFSTVSFLLCIFPCVFFHYAFLHCAFSPLCLFGRVSQSHPNWCRVSHIMAAASQKLKGWKLGRFGKNRRE